MEINKGLLLHWWHYYGKGIYTLAELEEFEKIIDEHGADKVLDLAVQSYIVDDGSPTVMLASIRLNRVQELLDTLKDIEKMKEEEKIVYNQIKEEFIEAISATYK